MALPDFHEIRFPVDIGLDLLGGPGFATVIAGSGSDIEQRNITRPARLEWDLDKPIENRTKINEVISFFRARNGKASGFRYKDWIDYRATDELLGVVTAPAETFQCIITYPDDINTTTRTIKKPVAGTFKVTVGGDLQVDNVDYTVDTTTGIITYNGSDTGVLSATFEFDVPVRFDTDKLPITLQRRDAGRIDGLPIIEDLNE